MPACPWCGTAAQVQTGSTLKGWHCRRCGREFEDETDGGDGDISYGKPERRMMREENRQERYQQRKAVRQ